MHADLRGMSLFDANLEGANLFGLAYIGQTFKGLHFAARSLRSVTQPVRVFEVLISGNVLSTELKLV